MSELSRYLFLAGAAPFLILGTAHAIATPLLPGDRRGLSPRDPQLADAMTRASVRLTSRTDMWRAWVGFNLSHSLGAVLFSLAVVLVGATEPGYAALGPAFRPFAFFVAALYAWIGAYYWFRTPIAGCLISATLFLAAWVLGVDVGEGRQAVLWTARVSLVLLCAAFAADGLRGAAARAVPLQGLAVSHGVHLVFVTALAAMTNGASLGPRASIANFVGGGLAYVVIFWGAWRPLSSATHWGVYWVWVVFFIAYARRALEMPWPYAIPVALLVLALAARLAPIVRPRAAEVA